MPFTLPRGGGPPPLLRILKSNLTIRSRLPVSGSGLYIKGCPFSSHTLLSRLHTSSSTNLGNFGFSRRPGCVDSVTNVHQRCVLGVRLSSTLDEMGRKKEAVKQEHGEDEVVKAEESVEEKKGVKQGHEEDEAVKAKEIEEQIEKFVQEEMKKLVVKENEEADEEPYVRVLKEETAEEYNARFPAIHDIRVKRKCRTSKEDDLGDDGEWDNFKTFVTLQGRKQGNRQPRVWVSFSKGKAMDEIVEVGTMQWPTGKEGASNAELDDREEIQHDIEVMRPLGKYMKFQVVEKTLAKGDRRIWREVVQKRTVDEDKGEGE